MKLDESLFLHLRAGEGWVEFRLKVLPRAPSNQICGWVQGALKVKVKAPPVQGKANKAVEEFLAQVLQVPKTKVQILWGESSRSKQVRVWGLDPRELLQRLEGRE